MSAPSKAGGKLIEDKRQMVEYFEAACKPASDWRLGTEHEKFVFRLDDLRPIPYEGEDGINAFLGELMRFGWESIEEDGKRIALSSGGCNITLEPGGQLELAGAPVEHVHQSCNEVHTHLHQVKTIAAEMNLGLIGLGFQPKWKREDIPWMPKQRYDIMRNYMPKVGTLGLDMMLRTTTVQVNIDYASEADMVKKFRVGLALQPIATALFANSPFTEGKPGPIPITSAPACCRSCSSPVWVLNAMWIMPWTCRCTSSIATDAISTRPACLFGISLKANYQYCRANYPQSVIGMLI